MGTFFVGHFNDTEKTLCRFVSLKLVRVKTIIPFALDGSKFGCSLVAYAKRAQGIDLFSLYILFSHFRPRDVLKGIFLLFFHKLFVHKHVHNY